MTFIVAIHDISDPERFWSAAEPSIIPSGVTLHGTYPTGDGKRAVCLWEAESEGDVRDVVEGALGEYSRNEYFTVDPQHQGAVGLPASAAATR